MDKLKKFKKYIYVSTKKRIEIEEICSKKKIYLQMAFINTYDFNVLFQEGLRNLNGVNYLFLDLESVINTTKNNQDIILNMTLIRKMYTDLRIIVLAEGYKAGNTLLRQNF